MKPRKNAKPRVPKKEMRSTILLVRLRVYERRVVEAIARYHGQTLSQFVRSRIIP